MNRKQLIGLFLIFFLVTAMTIMLLPISSAQNKTITGEPEIPGLDRFNKNIETAGGDVEIIWKIMDYNKSNDKLTFRIETENNDIKENIIISPSKLNQSEFNNETGEYRKTIDLDAGKYNFEWNNGNDLENLTLKYEITYQNKGYQESSGCYSSVFGLAFLTLAVIGTVFISKTK